MLIPIEQGHMAYRQMRGLPDLYHARLKHQGRTLAVLQGSSEQEAYERAQRLADVLLAGADGVDIQLA
jgi:hypothetical protein